MAEKLHVDLTGAPQTMLATLYAKALDADAERSLLHDRLARDTVERLDYDWSKTTITARTSPSVTTRSAHFDSWTRQFLAVNPKATVLHLGCGLDSRYDRLEPGPGVEWYDVDYPDVIDLRRQIFEPREHCHAVAASVTDPAWLADIPADRPTLMLGEGLTMYLTPQDGIALLRRVVDHAPSGEVQFDAFSRFGIKTQWTNRVVMRSGSRLHWGIDNPREVIEAVPGLRLLQWVPVFDSEEFAKTTRPYRLMAAVLGRIPGVRTMAQYHRYAF